MIIYKDKLFEHPIKILKAFNSEEVYSLLDEAEALAKTHYVVGYVRYEVWKGHYSSDYPLCYFEVFDDYKKYSPANLASVAIDSCADITFDEYSNAVESIKSEIRDGNSYEVNYTYDWKVRFDGEELDLYEFLLNSQRTPYNAFFKNEYDTVLSFSPELFFKLDGRHILTKPMKGTIGRGRDYLEDRANIEFLQNDVKNRAENVMIVDLLRNDLGRIAKTGSVKVDKLFEIETHKTLHQMTSEVQAELRDDIRLSTLMRAIFPCGSITGAPKISTMHIIDKLEKGLRDIYCGAIGYLAPDEIVFSVPIRILQKKRDEKDFRCRVGGAVVWDSSARAEWEETITKTRFLHSDYSLVETIKVNNGKMFLGEEHIDRLRNSARDLGFKFNKELEKIKPEQNGIMRILLRKDGQYNVEYKQYERTHINNVKISPISTSSTNYLLGYKTTYRPFYADTYRKISAGELYDEIFFNEKGELTEGARTNVLVEIGGKFYTPPLRCGLLNGVLRQSLVECGVCEEKVLYLDDLKKADSIYCINSVRGIKRVYCDFN